MLVNSVFTGPNFHDIERFPLELQPVHRGKFMVLRGNLRTGEVEVMVDRFQRGMPQDLFQGKDISSVEMNPSLLFSYFSLERTFFITRKRITFSNTQAAITGNTFCGGLIPMLPAAH